MKVLTRELDAFDPAMIAIERVGQRCRASHPQSVGRVFEPLAVQRSEPGRSEVLRGCQIALVSRAGTGFGEAFPLREKPLKNLNVRGFQTRTEVLAHGELVDQARLPKRPWEQQPNRPSEEHTQQGHMPQKEQPEVHR